MTPPSEPLYPVKNGKKICSREDCKFAGAPQPIECFARNPTLKSGINSHCKTCGGLDKKKWIAKQRQANPESFAAKSRARSATQRRKDSHRAWYLRRREELNAATKAWRKANPEEVRRLHIRRRFRQYQVTPEWYDIELAKQGGGCAICGSKDPKNSWGTFNIDHDHRCCKKSCHACDKCRRGLLCSACNVRLAHIENVEWMKRAVAYLKQHEQNLAS